jgi:hypothetical protein
MDCFYHENAQACGICKSCQRGLCKQCASEVNNGIACKGQCEEHAVELDNFVLNAIKMQGSNDVLVQSASASIGAAEYFQLVLGAIFMAYGIYEETTLLILLGVAFLLFGGFGIFKILKIRSESAPPPNKLDLPPRSFNAVAMHDSDSLTKECKYEENIGY